MFDKKIECGISFPKLPFGRVCLNLAPPLPGINWEGDYLKDDAPDPVRYLKKKVEREQTSLRDCKSNEEFKKINDVSLKESYRSRGN